MIREPTKTARAARAQASSIGGWLHWSDGTESRIFLNSRVHLYSIDAETGRLVKAFGTEGRVSLIAGFHRPVDPEAFDQTSPPVVYQDLVIVGSHIPDRVQRRFDTPGSVQAFGRAHRRETLGVLYGAAVG